MISRPDIFSVCNYLELSLIPDILFLTDTMITLLLFVCMNWYYWSYRNRYVKLSIIKKKKKKKKKIYAIEGKIANQTPFRMVLAASLPRFWDHYYVKRCIFGHFTPYRSILFVLSGFSSLAILYILVIQ